MSQHRQHFHFVRSQDLLLFVFLIRNELNSFRTFHRIGVFWHFSKKRLSKKRAILLFDKEKSHLFEAFSEVKLIQHTEIYILSCMSTYMQPSMRSPTLPTHTHSTQPTPPQKTWNLKEYLLCMRLWSAGWSGREFSGGCWWSHREEKRSSSLWNQLGLITAAEERALNNTFTFWNREPRYGEDV